MHVKRENLRHGLISTSEDTTSDRHATNPALERNGASDGGLDGAAVSDDRPRQPAAAICDPRSRHNFSKSVELRLQLGRLVVGREMLRAAIALPCLQCSRVAQFRMTVIGEIATFATGLLIRKR